VINTGVLPRGSAVGRAATRTSGTRPGASTAKRAVIGISQATAEALGVADADVLRKLPQDELIALVEQALGGGITLSFAGKTNATRIARKVRPRDAPDKDAQRRHGRGASVKHLDRR
jgi:hypothetical protein